ncbi:MAG: DUF2029 domain-containing protein [Candidatus Aminicenantes bacterium]|nr:DUF2029 domain-containing protein [Candidatus Aminicenantes bacterium]
MDLRLRRRLFAAGLVLAAASAFFLRVEKRMVDFTVNYQAGDRISRGETLYRTQDEHYQFKYSPYCAVIYLPLSFLPLPAAKGLWFVLMAAAMAAIVLLTRRLLGPRSEGFFWASAVWPAVVLAKFFVRELDLGQINAVVAAILLGMAVLLAQDEARRSPVKAALAGFLWGTAVAMKPYAAIFLPYFFVKRKWNVLWPGLLVLAVSFFAPAAFFGFPGNLTVHLEWIESLSKSTPALLSSQDNVSILAFLVKKALDLGLARLVYGGAVLVLGWAVFLFVRRGRTRQGSLFAEAALLLMLIPLVSPLGWDYTFLAAFPAVALVFAHFRSFPPVVRVLLAVNFAVIGLSLYDVLGREAYAAFMNASVLTVNFLVLAAALFALRFSGKA